MKKHEYLVQDIISKICQGSINKKLPSERELSERYKTSRFTIRKALSKLEAIGIVISKIGSGYYVNTSIINTPLIYNSITENKFNDISYKKIKLHKKLPTPNEVQAFSITSEDYVWYIKRLRSIKNQAIQIEEMILPTNIFKKIDDKIIENSLQMYVLSLGLNIDSYLTTYKAVTLTKEDSELLNCKRSSAAMSITSRGFLKSGDVFVISNIIDINYQCTYHSKFNPESINFRVKNN